MPIVIRRALPQDAQAIVELIAAAFHEEANAKHVQSLIEEGEHLTFVAEDEKVVGFIDGFYTFDGYGFKRLELDLLAVHPEHSGQGIGKALIRKFTESHENADLIRALVAVNNTPMQHAMRANAFKQDHVSSSLYVSSEGLAFPSSNKFSLIPVKTFTYTGIWIEGAIKEGIVEAAHHQRESLGFEIVGHVIPDIDNEIFAPRLAIIKASGLNFVKQFHWWQTIITPKLEFLDKLIKAVDKRETNQ